MCCDLTTSSTVTWNGTGVAPDACSVAVGSIYPTPTELKGTSATYAGSACSTATPGLITITLGGHTNTDCNGTWTVNQNKITTPAAGC